jgi:replicative DNA helicase Mcm
MEASEQVRRFEEFFEDSYKTEILESSRKGRDFIAIDFKKLAKFDPELADSLLEEPDEVIAAADLAVKQFDIKKKFNIRFKCLPESQKIMIRNIRSINLNKMYTINGIVRQKSDVRPQVTAAKFECPSCGNIINVLQLEQKFKEPSRCGCGRKGKFRLLSKELIDAQGITLEEAPEDLEGGEQPKRMRIFLKDDLVSPISDKYSNPGSKVLVNGVIKETPLTGRDGTKLTRFDLLFEANYMEPMQEDYLDLTITKEEEKEIRKLADDPNRYEQIANSMAPSIYGHEKIKEALVLQLVGGVKKERTDGIITRGDMHILLIGDPGAGKSQMLKRFSKVAPKSRYVSGKGVSGAGLTASVVKDEFLGGWALG